jgi:23S rRNA G2445 N2-methylase RlmL
MDADRKLEEAVRKAMVYDKRLSSQPIEISVKEAIVYLLSNRSMTRRSATRFNPQFVISADVQALTSRLL